MQTLFFIILTIPNQLPVYVAAYEQAGDCIEIAHMIDSSLAVGNAVCVAGME